MQKIRVLNVIEEGRFGGPQKRIAEVSHKLKQYGVDTIVVVPRDNSSKTLEELAKLSVAVRPIALHRLTKDIKHLLKFLSFFVPEILEIKKIIESEKVSIVHCNGSWQYKAIIASKMAGVESVWHLNDTSMPTYVLLLFKLVSKFAAKNYIFACQRSKEFYFGNQLSATGEVETIQAPVDTDVLTSEKFNRKALSQYDGIKVLTVGNVVPVKGHDTFIKMASWLSENVNNEINFFIAGSEWGNQGPYIKNLKLMLKKYNLSNVHFLGGRSDVAELLNSADYYVCSSNFEASPISVWEAMSMGKSIVSTDVGDVRDIFSKFDCGIVVDTKDYVSLGKGLKRLIDDEQSKEYYETRSRETAEKYLDIKICVEKHVQIYKKILQCQ